MSNRRTYAILTREAHPDVAPIHHRMPIALTPEGARAWLTADHDAELLTAHLAAGTCTRYIAEPVSTAINKPEYVSETIRGYTSPPSQP